MCPARSNPEQPNAYAYPDARAQPPGCPGMDFGFWGLRHFGRVRRWRGGHPDTRSRRAAGGTGLTSAAERRHSHCTRRAGCECAEVTVVAGNPRAAGRSGRTDGEAGGAIGKLAARERSMSSGSPDIKAPAKVEHGPVRPACSAISAGLRLVRPAGTACGPQVLLAVWPNGGVQRWGELVWLPQEPFRRRHPPPRRAAAQLPAALLSGCAPIAPRMEKTELCPFHFADYSGAANRCSRVTPSPQPRPVQLLCVLMHAVERCGWPALCWPEGRRSRATLRLCKGNVSVRSGGCGGTRGSLATPHA